MILVRGEILTWAIGKLRWWKRESERKRLFFSFSPAEDSRNWGRIDLALSIRKRLSIKKRARKIAPGKKKEAARGGPSLRSWSSTRGKARGEGNKQLSVIKRDETDERGGGRKEDPLELLGREMFFVRDERRGTSELRRRGGRATNGGDMSHSVALWRYIWLLRTWKIILLARWVWPRERASSVTTMEICSF